MKSVLSIILLIVTICLTGCGSQQIQPGPLHVIQASNKYDVKVQISSTPAKTLQKNKLYITLTDVNHNKVSNAKVTVSLTMKSMNHGELKVPAVLTDKGIYLAEVIPVMNGKWTAEVTALIQDHTVKTIYNFEAKK